MNILCEQLPDTAEIDGVEYELNTDFRICLRIILACEDNELTNQEKITIMIRFLYKKLPSNLSEAARIGKLFLDCGDDKEKENIEEPRVFSFEKDANYIYTAINQTHHIDLEQVGYMHWWKFVYMFRDINENTFFSKLVDLRSRKQRGKLTKEEKEACAKMHDIIDLPHVKTAEETAAENRFLELFGKC